MPPSRRVPSAYHPFRIPVLRQAASAWLRSQLRNTGAQSALGDPGASAAWWSRPFFRLIRFVMLPGGLVCRVGFSCCSRYFDLLCNQPANQKLCPSCTVPNTNWSCLGRGGGHDSWHGEFRQLPRMLQVEARSEWSWPLHLVCESVSCESAQFWSVICESIFSFDICCLICGSGQFWSVTDGTWYLCRKSDGFRYRYGYKILPTTSLLAGGYLPYPPLTWPDVIPMQTCNLGCCKSKLFAKYWC
jgi:hypothetical protein